MPNNNNWNNNPPISLGNYNDLRNHSDSSKNSNNIIDLIIPLASMIVPSLMTALLTPKKTVNYKNATQPAESQQPPQPILPSAQQLSSQPQQVIVIYLPYPQYTPYSQQFTSYPPQYPQFPQFSQPYSQYQQYPLQPYYSYPQQYPQFPQQYLPYQPLPLPQYSQPQQNTPDIINVPKSIPQLPPPLPGAK